MFILFVCFCFSYCSFVYFLSFCLQICLHFSRQLKSTGQDGFWIPENFNRSHQNVWRGSLWACHWNDSNKTNGFQKSCRFLLGKFIFEFGWVGFGWGCALRVQNWVNLVWVNLVVWPNWVKVMTIAKYSFDHWQTEHSPSRQSLGTYIKSLILLSMVQLPKDRNCMPKIWELWLDFLKATMNTCKNECLKKIRPELLVFDPLASFEWPQRPQNWLQQKLFFYFPNLQKQS